jgi:DNA repair ATPase RecN
MYSTFFQSVLSARSKAAKFYRVDLHIHSPDSHDYPSTHDKPGFVQRVPDEEENLRENPSAFAPILIRTAKEKGLSLVAITDHNRADLAEQSSAMSDEDLVILPGIEIAVQTTDFPDSTIHLLGIFPKGTTSIEIDKVFPAGCGMPPSRDRGPGDRTGTPLDVLIRTIKELHGICIAAHVTSNKGARVMVLAQNVEWLQKNYLRSYLKSLGTEPLADRERALLAKLEEDLKPLDDETQNEYLRFLARYDFDAIQIQSPEHEQHYRGAHVEGLGLKPFACLLCSDAHTIADVGCLGHASHIKMAEVGVDGIAKALRDPETRIRYDSTLARETPSRILGMAFEGGFFDGQAVGFSDNLTALIGGRGTGKSALIEAIRLILGHSLERLPDKLREDIEERLDFTLEGAEVKMLYEAGHDNNPIIVKRRFGEAKSACYSIDGELIPEVELPSSRLVRAEIYGWSEIEELSDSSTKQLYLLDRTVEGIEGQRLDIQSRLEAIRGNSDALASLCREISAILPQVENAGEVRRQLSEFQSAALDEAFANFDRNEGAISTLKELGDAVAQKLLGWLTTEGNRREIVGGFAEVLASTLESLESYEWAEEFVKELTANLEQIQVHYDAIMELVSGAEEALGARLEQITAERVAIQQDLNVAAEQSGQADFKTALSRRQELTETLTTIQGFEKDIGDKSRQMADLFDTRRRSLVPALTEARQRLFRARQLKSGAISEKLAGLEAANGVTVTMVELGNTDPFRDALGHRAGSSNLGLFRGIDRHYLIKDYPGYFSTKFSPHAFVEALLGDASQADRLNIDYVRSREEGRIVRLVEGIVTDEDGRIVERDSDSQEISSYPSDEYEHVALARGEDVWKHLSPYYYAGEQQLYPDPDRLRAVLDLESLPIEDLPVISLENRPIEKLSPGQRCSAVIPIILVEGDSPLIIDQPEDNLDNRLVFELVVDILRGLKEKRQIIVATHNPNIPVSGDAEQVVVFDAPEKRVCKVVCQASIDDDDIIDNIKAIMEGGEDAFEMRMVKYGIRPERVRRISPSV